MSHRWNGSLFHAAGLLAFWSCGLAGGVVINEIHFNPPGGSEQEFIELFNPSAEAVSIAGWSFVDGITYTFPEGAAIPARGMAVIARNPQEFSGVFNIPAGSVFGPNADNLANGGEKLVLVDARGSVIDEVDFSDEAPWPTAADGLGGSLERICFELDAQNPANWASDSTKGPTPLNLNNGSQCPPPAQPVPRVIINEINYHPLQDRDALEEYVELYNTTDSAIDLQNYSFTQGIGEFKFVNSTPIAPRGYLVVARNQERIRTLFGITNVAGDYQGQLSNDGERLTLSDPDGKPVDSVRYRDGNDWPVSPDGIGRSLEKIQPAAAADDPASWQPSGWGDITQWRSVSATALAPSSIIYVYMLGEGEFLMDDIVLTRADAPGGPNLIANGAFDAGVEGWTIAGNHLDSTWQAAQAPETGGQLHVIATGRGSGTRNGLVYTIDPPLEENSTIYKLSFRYRYLSGTQGLVLRIAGASPSRGIYIDLQSRPILTPGEKNSVYREALPPYITGLGRFPREPRSTDETWISARVRGNSVNGVYLLYKANNDVDDQVVEMLDDGASNDGEKGDGVFSGKVPPQAHNSIVTFRITAEDLSGAVTSYPQEADPTGVSGFYVNDLQPASKLPVFHLLVDHLSTRTPRSILDSMNCDTYRGMSFAYRGDLFHNGGIRQRGQSVCKSTKPFLKVRFNRGREFEDRRKINLQSIWTDKALVREHLAWEVFHDMDLPYCTTRYVRLHCNGKYYGLYSELEHPDARFLKRNGLNGDGNLYKAFASTEQKMTDYHQGYEKKTNEEDTSFADLADFLNTMHATPNAQIIAFFQNRTVEDAIVDYQVSQMITNNADYPHKNHYLYHDTEKDQWMPLTWDMDLTFGKYWDGNNSGVLNDRMDNPGLNPWYTTRVDGGIGNYLLDKFFFVPAGKYYQRALVVRLWDALNEKYTEALYNDKLAVLHDLLFEEQKDDMAAWNRSPASANDRTAPKDFEPNLDRVRNHIKVRRAFLFNYLKSHDKFTDHDRMKITEIYYNPPGDGEEAEYLELYNPSGREIQIAGWTIDGIEFAFPESTAVADGEVIVVAKNPTLFKKLHGEGIRVFGPYAGQLDNSGEELRLRDVGPGYPATVDLVHYEDKFPWPAGADGLGSSIELTDVTPFRDNDVAENWRASDAPGGTPGQLPAALPPFRRGDCNDDGKVNISDAISILGTLFRGQGAPHCHGACDADDDQEISITDPIHLLNYLFLSGTAIPAPGPFTCGTSVSASCESSHCSVN